MFYDTTESGRGNLCRVSYVWLEVHASWNIHLVRECRQHVNGDLGQIHARAAMVISSLQISPIERAKILLDLTTSRLNKVN